VDGLGVDIVSIVGTECGGHPSMEGVTTLVLIPQTVDAIRAPLIAGGGFCDGRTFVVGLALGAAAVNMGTRFMVTQECPIPQVMKDKMVATPENATVIVQQSIGSPTRVLRNAWAEKVIELEDRHATFDELREYITGETSVRGWRAGNLEEGLVPMGQVVGRIHNIPTVAELMASLIEEAVQAKKKLDALF
jgi:NAD(P)H-dependent flavin oxidoreductase YrpB (nitropropane dioxygenase family)